MNKETYIVLYKDEQECQEWTLEEIIEHINRDRSEEWIDYDKTDWKEGWNEWVKPEGFYTLLDNEDEYSIIDAEADTIEDDFQYYVYTNGEVVPIGTPIGVEYNEKLYLFSNILFGI